jgi:hypothetical protein
MGEFLRKLQEEKGDVLEDNEVLLIKKIDFDRYRIATPIPRQNIPTSYSTSTKASPSINPTINNDVKDFAKGIKQDKTQYEVLKDERHFETWYLGFIIVARSHDILDVFDDTYILNADDKALFEKKQYYAYTGLHNTLTIDMGKTMVRKHKDTGDAQKLWKEFITYMRTSTKAQILSTDLLSWITSTKYDSS